MDQKKIDAINSLVVTDYSCEGGECEYVLVEDSLENRKVLLNAGFTEKDLSLPEVKPDKDDDTLDVSWLAFAIADSDWFNPDVGFGDEDAMRIGGNA